MKVTVHPDNLIILDSDDIAEIATFVKALRNGSAPAPATPRKKRGPYKKKAKPESVKDAELSSVQFATWEWLVAHDDPAGIHVNAIAEGLGINVHAVTFRCNKLIEKGLVHRIRRGRYRPGELPHELPHDDLPQQPIPASESDAEPPE